MKRSVKMHSVLHSKKLSNKLKLKNLAQRKIILITHSNEIASTDEELFIDSEAPPHRKKKKKSVPVYISTSSGEEEPKADKDKTAAGQAADDDYDAPVRLLTVRLHSICGARTHTHTYTHTHTRANSRTHY